MNLSRPRIIAISVAAVVVLAIGVRACGSDAPPPEATSTAPAPIAEPAPMRSTPSSDTAAPEAESAPVVVPSNADPGPRTRTRERTTRPPKKRVTALPGGISRVAEQVTWPDARRVAQASVRAGQILATLYGRQPAATTRVLGPLMSESALGRVRARLAEDPPPRGTPVARARIIAINLSNDPATGSRTAQVYYDYPANANGGLGQVRLEFAPTSPEIIDWGVDPAE